jgi:prolyl-tRNA editing enzyme YbaK/EbsC (Cys-tRNA(Pro) deacylase)
VAWRPVADALQLLATPVRDALGPLVERADVFAGPIDPELSDTAQFCAAYDVPMEQSANCVVIAGKRDGEPRYAAAVVPATLRADVNGVVRRRIDVRKASFLPVTDAIALTGMEFGGITPIGLPAQWPVLVDTAVVDAGTVVIGSGIRGSKIVLPGALLAALPTAEILPALAR